MSALYCCCIISGVTDICCICSKHSKHNKAVHQAPMHGLFFVVPSSLRLHPSFVPSFPPSLALHAASSKPNDIRGKLRAQAIAQRAPGKTD